jgi:hypothetical protein
MRSIAGALLLAGWAAFWFWAFSFAYSDSFFLYNRHSRIPILIVAVMAAVLVPISAVHQWKQHVKEGRKTVQSLLTHGATSLIILSAPFAVTWILSKASRPWRLGADDAMGAGIDLLYLFAIATASIATLGVALALSRHARKDTR